MFPNTTPHSSGMERFAVLLGYLREVGSEGASLEELGLVCECTRDHVRKLIDRLNKEYEGVKGTHCVSIGGGKYALGDPDQLVVSGQRRQRRVVRGVRRAIVNTNALISHPDADPGTRKAAADNLARLTSLQRDVKENYKLTRKAYERPWPTKSPRGKDA